MRHTSNTESNLRFFEIGSSTSARLFAGLFTSLDTSTQSSHFVPALLQHRADILSLINFGIQPLVELLRIQNNQHPIVNLFHE